MAPQSSAVEQAFLKIQANQSTTHILQKLCFKFVVEEDGQAGKDALSYLARSGQISGQLAAECFDLVLKGQNVREKDIQDDLVASLLRVSHDAQTLLTQRLQDFSTVIFNELYEIGDGSANELVTVVLDSSSWPNEQAQETGKRDVFQLFLAQLMAVGRDLDARALRGISRMLAVDAAQLHSLIDEQSFHTILTSLDNRLPVEVRNKATLATASFLDAVKEKGQTAFSRFIHHHVARHNSEDLVLAFSAIAAVFPLAQGMASELLLTESFVPSLVPLLEKRINSEQVKQAALDMLSAACQDSACRQIISKHCTGWLQNVIVTGKEKRPGSAAVILAKIQGPAIYPSNGQSGDHQDGKYDIDDLLSMFRDMMVSNDEANKQRAVEGLAYASIHPKVKDCLSSDKEFLAEFFAFMQANQASSATVFGALAIIENLTRYLPNLSEEQQRMAQLKAYANASKESAKPDALDEDGAVTARCIELVNSGVVSTLLAVSKKASSASIAVISKILLSISRPPTLRGTIAQQGGIKLLLQHYPPSSAATTTESQTRRSAAHALARILISTDPSLAFTSGPPPLTSAIRPLLSLLKEDSNHISQGPRDLLPAFEALLALTNLASTPSPEAAEMIIRLDFPTIEDLLLGNSQMIRRASTELVCNLMTCPSGIKLFADGSKAAGRRLHILLALADVDDSNTRRAAGGALATLTEFPGAVTAILARDRGAEILLSLCEDEDIAIIHRGLVCVRNVLYVEEASAKVVASDKIRNANGLDVLKRILQKFKNDYILALAIEALRAL